ncbi:MAG: DUF433 domain-containing protein [Thermoplasmatota archaeon]
MERILADPAILAGKPVIRGTRVPVHIVLRLLAAGESAAAIVHEYPQLTQADIEACLQYAAHILAHTEWVEVGVV